MSSTSGNREQQGGASEGAPRPDPQAAGDIKIPQAEAELKGQSANPNYPSITAGQGLSASDAQGGGVAGKIDAGLGGGLGGPFRPAYK